MLEAENSEENGAVTVYQVLRGIREHLERTVTVEEFASFAGVPGLQQAIIQTFHARCESLDRMRSITQGDAEDHTTSAQSEGIKRVDCLLGMHHFIGITGVEEDPSHWVANFI